MITKWKNYITESVIFDMINEGKCCASDEFLSNLEKISDRSKVAKELHNIFYDEVESESNLVHNYIDISGQEGMVSFFPDSRTLTHSPLEDFFTMRGRGEIAVGRMARVILSKSELYSGTPFTDKDYEIFVNLYKSLSKSVGTRFELVSGKDIRKWYNEKNYADGNGTLGGSCMRDEDCEDYFDIYVKNPEVCSLLVYLNEKNMVMGRALVWTLSESPSESKIFMDRVYTNKDSDVLKFISYADEKGWMYKFMQNSHDLEGILFRCQGGIYVGRIKADLKKSDFNEYPFVDTLCNLDEKNKTLSNVPTKKTCCLDDTEGGMTDECWECGGEGIVDGECKKCRGGGDIECPDCSGTGESKCPKCNGVGNTNREVECPDCKGEGRVRKVIRKVACGPCKGSGVIYEICDKCDGSGDVKCKKCDGNGDVDCPSCDGDGEVEGVDCPDCVGFYQRTLEMFAESDESRIKDKAREALEKYLSEKEEKKSGKKKKK